jgi:hypothetical protein
MSAVGGKGKASIATPGELDARDHPAFETIRSITRLVAIHTPGVLVSARDVDFVCRLTPWFGQVIDMGLVLSAALCMP